MQRKNQQQKSFLQDPFQWLHTRNGIKQRVGYEITDVEPVGAVVKYTMVPGKSMEDGITQLPGRLVTVVRQLFVEAM